MSDQWDCLDEGLTLGISKTNLTCRNNKSYELTKLFWYLLVDVKMFFDIVIVELQRCDRSYLMEASGLVIVLPCEL